MSNDLELLNFIYQNAEMGKDTITHLIQVVDSVEFRKHLEVQLTEYQNIFDTADQALQKKKQEAEGIGAFAKISSYMMINFKTLLDKSPSHIAEMMIQGSTMGTVDMTKRIKEYEDSVQPETLKLAKQLLKTEQHNIEEMKKFL
ncbi:MAG: hypothetical protein HFE39_03225 [Clostridiales bacterium]|jgi:hypothetical protein|nr:hypothetical protein [Clostridiales bacterium]